jgi:hypothetical protein
MVATIMASTASGSTYLMSIEAGGVRWFRVPPSGSLATAAAGWQASLPRVVPGERLLLGPLLSTPVVEVAVLPGPPVALPEWSMDDSPSAPVQRQHVRGEWPRRYDEPIGH